MNYWCIDIGNTRIKVAFFEGNQLKELLIFQHFGVVEARNLLQQHPEATIIISSTAKDNNELIEVLKLSHRWIQFTQNTPVPFINEYATPQTLGLDRIALAAAAVSLFPGENVLVIDAGTCITLEMIEKSGKYLGGSIHPGIKMRLEAMHRYTGKLPLLTPENAPSLTGNDTTTCMQAGAVLGAAKEIDGFISAYLTQYPDCKVILTGGDADKFFSMLKNEIFALPNLVLMGLQKIAEYNVKY
jgi:type III pantothenate kinase